MSRFGLISCSLLLLELGASAQDIAWKIAMDVAAKAIQEHRFTDAEDSYQHALELARESSGSPSLLTLPLLSTISPPSDLGMVIANVANPSHPVQVGPAILPAAGITTASAIADGITFTNMVAYVGTWADGGILYGFDYSTAAHPRMVAVMPEGTLCDSVLTLQNDGTDLFDGGALDAFPFVDIDLSQPRNVINFYPIFASAINAETGNACDVTFQTAQSRRARTSYAAMRARLRRRK